MVILRCYSFITGGRNGVRMGGQFAMESVAGMVWNMHIGIMKKPNK